MTPTDVRAALHEVRDATEVPVLDRVAFQRRVRAERRRRTAGRVLVAGAAAAVVVAGVALAGVGAGDERRVDPGPADRPAATEGLSGTVFFVVDGRLIALDPAGVVHDLDLEAEAVVGWTSERAYVLDDEGRLVVRTVSYDGEGSGHASFGTAPSPVSERVRTMELSGDGRYLGWTGLDDVAHRYDLAAGREDLTLAGNAGARVVGVGAEGLLLSSPEGLVVRDAGSVVQVPVTQGWRGEGAQLASGHVLVNGPGETATLLEVGGGRADPVAMFEATGVLGPYAERVALLDGTGLEVWDGDAMAPPTGLDAVPDQLRWADETTLLVSAHDGEDGLLYACDIGLVCLPLPVAGEVDLGR